MRKRLGTPTSRTWFVSPVIVYLIYWAATYGKEFIVLMLLLPKRHWRVEGCFNQCSPFYHMLCDVASIFAVRTLVVSQAYTMVLTLIYNT